MDGHNNRSIIQHIFSWGCKLAALGFLVVGVICLLLVAGMIYEGGVWAHVLYAEKPIPHFLGGMGALFMAYLLSYGIHNTRKDWMRFLGRSVLATFSLFVSFGVGEIGLRAYNSALQNAQSMEKFKAARRQGKPIKVHSTHALGVIIQPSENLKVMYELQPHLDMEFGNRHLISNSDGMRESREYPIPRIPHSVRIIGIGDSGMFGWNLEQNEDYLAVLETNLNARQDGRVYEVLNMAVPGYNTQLEVESLRDKGLKYRPDIVVIGWCDNDYSLPFFLLEKENYHRRDVSFLYNLLFKRSPLRNNRTEVAPGFTLRDQREFDKEQVVPELTAGDDVGRVGKVLAELKKLADQNGFHVLIFGPMRSLICQQCREAGIPYCNTYDVIPAEKYPKEYLIYFMHPNKNGHRVLAEYLEKDLAGRGWLSSSNAK